MLAPLRAAGGGLRSPEWPARPVLQRLLDRDGNPVRTASGVPLRLASAGSRRRSFEERYEARVHLKGEMAFRDGDWHDLLNLLVWRTFPRSKAALNARHFEALEAQRAAARANRGPAQDALTLFDEGGVIVVSDDDELLASLREWRWKDLFWVHRARLRARMRFVLFGHALYEKALRPFIGITGRGILLKTEPDVLTAPLREQLAIIDARVAEHLSGPAGPAATRELAVVPILGVPGWCADNENEAFYENQDYFRPGRRSTMDEG